MANTTPATVPGSFANAPYVPPPFTPPVHPAAPIAPTGSAGATGATGSSAVSIPQSFLNADGTFKSPDQIASEAGAAMAAAHGQPDVGSLAIDQFNNGGSSADAEAAARRIDNTRNDIAVGATDPYKVASQSGIAYTPEELNAIEKAYAGVYDPALDTALAKVNQKQAADAQANAPFTLGTDQVRYDGQGNPIAAGPSSATTSPGSDLSYYIKTTANGNKYVDLSTVTDAKEKAALQDAAQAAGVPPVTDADAAKINAIDDTRSNLAKQIEDQFAKVGYTNGFTKALGGFGASNSVEEAFGNADIGSFNAWRTAAINSIQALAGGVGSGIRINQAEINSAMENDIPNKSDTVAVGNAKIAVLKNQLNNWENQLLGTTGSGAAPAAALSDDEVQYLKSPAGGGYSDDQINSYESTGSFSPVGNTTASTTKTSLNVPQRNNNPGDLKTGGLSDKLAVGTDPQGHLIFPDATTGFRALVTDLTAKISGNSKYLPANPTIAELGKVYAQDPNWSVKVAAIIGVPVTARTQDVPLDKLAHAIAVQEGFYA